MTVHSRDGAEQVPAGAVTLLNGSSLWIRVSTTRVDQAKFDPGEYTVQLEATTTAVQQLSASGSATRPAIDTGFPMHLQVVALSSEERWRQFHMIEGGFYERLNSERALEHYAALAEMPGAAWSQSLPLATMYNDLGRYREASAVFRRILPELIRSLEMPLGHIIRDARHLRNAAMNLAADGDTRTAADLLRLEGLTPQNKLAEEVERLRQYALSRRK